MTTSGHHDWHHSGDAGHRRLATVMRLGALLRDTLTIGIGVGLIIATPPSIQEFGAADFTRIAWSFLPLVGGAVGVYGVVRGSTRAEIIGSFTVGSGFLVWTVAAAVQPHPTLVSYTVAAAFAVLALCSVLRGMAAAAGLLAPDRGV